MAKYKFHQRSFWNDRLYEKGEEIEIKASIKPGPHMEPLDDEARQAAKEGGVAFTGEIPDVLGKLLPMYEKAAAQHGSDKLTPTALADAMAMALDRILGSKLAPRSDADIQAEVDRRVAEELEKLTADPGKGKGKKGGEG